MNRYTTRVLLHFSHQEENYETLHEEMKKRGFTRTIIDTNTNIEYHLPTAEYNFIGADDRQQVFNKAEAAAKITGLKYAILVTPTAGRIWEGLDIVKK